MITVPTFAHDDGDSDLLPKMTNEFGPFTRPLPKMAFSHSWWSAISRVTYLLPELTRDDAQDDTALTYCPR
jgi:hypothetical protein